MPVTFHRSSVIASIGMLGLSGMAGASTLGDSAFELPSIIKVLSLLIMLLGFVVSLATTRIRFLVGGLILGFATGIAPTYLAEAGRTGPDAGVPRVERVAEPATRKDLDASTKSASADPGTSAQQPSAPRTHESEAAGASLGSWILPFVVGAMIPLLVVALLVRRTEVPDRARLPIAEYPRSTESDVQNIDSLSAADTDAPPPPDDPSPESASAPSPGRKLIL